MAAEEPATAAEESAVREPKFTGDQNTLAFERKLCDLKLESLNFAERVGLESYLDISPYGRYITTLPELAYIARGAASAATPSTRSFVDRMAYDSLQVAKLIYNKYVDEMKSCWKALPETEWDGNGFPNAVDLSDTNIPNVSAYLKRLFEWHHGELVAVSDEWVPYAEQAGGGLPVAALRSKASQWRLASSGGAAKPATGGSVFHQLASGGVELWHLQFLASKADRQRQKGAGVDSLVYKRLRPGRIGVREALVFSLPTLVWNMWNQATLLELYAFYMKRPLVCLKGPPRGPKGVRPW